MATNKNAIIRYQALDKCFRNTGRRYYINDLLKACNDALKEIDPNSTGIKRRQIYEDINFMKDSLGYDAPIESYKDGRKAYYRYEDSGFSINNSPLNTTEAEQLKNAISILQRFEGAPQFEWMNEIGPMLSTHFGLNNSEKKIMSYDTNIDYSGYDKIMPLFNAIVNKKVLQITYEPFNKKAFEFIFHPYYLKQFNNRWFVFGLNQMLNLPKWNLALDRIININEIENEYIEDKTDWEEHFYDIIGVTTPDNAKLEEIELIFSKEQANYIYTKPIHPSQKAKFLESGELLVKLKLIPNYELETILMKYIDSVKVIKPKQLKNNIIKRLKKAFKNYI